jgi:SRSO17 transposase
MQEVQERNYWGLSTQIYEMLGSKLQSMFETYRFYLKTRTHDGSSHGLTMLKGYFLMETGRNYVKIEQTVTSHLKDGQALQQFMSDSPWETDGIFQQVRQDIVEKFQLRGGMLNFDESGDDCADKHKAGAGRQYLGRLGKVDMGQVGVLSSYYQAGVWFLTDADLFLPAGWFKPVHALWSNEKERLKLFKRLHIPAERVFQTKLELAQQQFDRALASGLDFEIVGGDSFYGRDTSFRRYIDRKSKFYMVCVPKDTGVWLQNPMSTQTEKGNIMQTVTQIAEQSVFEALQVRPSERGLLTAEHAFARIWTQNANEPLIFREEILVIRREKNGKLSFALSNGLNQSHPILALWRSQRYFVERTIQDTKSELGWDELQARKYRAYLHTLALCAMALVFIADVKIEQRTLYAEPQRVLEELQIPQLPDLSVANVKTLLKKVFPLPELTKKQAVESVIKTLFGRVQATQSKFRKNSS